jgi:hypothetical protein
MEERGGADQIGTCLEGNTAGGLGLFEVLDRREVPIGQGGVGERPQVLGRLEFRRVGGQEQQMPMLGNTEPQTTVPACAIEDEPDLLGGARADLLGEGGEFRLKEGNGDRRGQMEDRAARSRMDEANEVAPGIAVLDRRERALPVETPDLVQDRLQADAMFVREVDGPQLDAGLWEGGGDGAQQRPQFFLNASCCSGSAWTCRGRGLRRLPLRRTRYVQPSCTLTGRPSRALIHAATVRPSQSSPSGAGPRRAVANSASSSPLSTRAARCEWVKRRLCMPAGPTAL